MPLNPPFTQMENFEEECKLKGKKEKEKKRKRQKKSTGSGLEP